MSIRMLIDASHREETRVAIVDGNQLEDFDYESSAKKQLKGSIYLAKVTRVEPSLQAAFIDYGGNRHGFLAFSEIHPDYYQIPVADREALIAAEAEANADLLEDEEVEEKPKRRKRRTRRKKEDFEAAGEKENSGEETTDEVNKHVAEEDDADNAQETLAKNDETEAAAEDIKTKDKKPKPKRKRGPSKSKTKAEATKDSDVIEEDLEVEEDAALHVDEHINEVQTVSENTDAEETEDVKVDNRSEEEDEERLRIRMAKRLRYKYKIQEVIKKNQIILIQVVKEERGNKGAALTTYLSLPGRYCVLMPNTLHGGGVSRKIANISDRKKLKNILASLRMPKGHACIIRTAGADRTKAEIKRDYDYLKRMWEAIRENTLKSIAPTQIYEEGNLIKRSIRDRYTRDISEIIVEGERGYKTAKNFMNLLMPSHTKKIKNYHEKIPLFQKYQVENYLDSIYSPTAQLKSGGYIVINPTEALVSIDVNSGRATKEHNIEETALKTNLEAAEEVARQLKLRDMAGLIVIDFIDMEDQRNDRAVERKLKACLKNDRARIQVGRISSFGLLEMSRQRLRVGVLESSTTACPHCAGSGLLRSVESQSLHILRIIEEEGMKSRNSRFVVYLPSQVAVYILNNKRNKLIDLEKRYDFSVAIEIDNELTASEHRMEKSGKPSNTAQQKNDSLRMGRDVNKLIDVTEEDVSTEEDSKERSKRRRRRRRGGQNRNHNAAAENTENTENKDDERNEQNEKEDFSDDSSELEHHKRRPRRTKRRTKPAEEAISQTEASDDPADKNPEQEPEIKTAKEPDTTKKGQSEQEPALNKSDDASTVAEDKPKPKRARRKKVASTTSENNEKTITKEEAPKDKKAEAKTETPDQKNVKEEKPKKKGWWSR